MPLHRQPSRGCPVRSGDGSSPLAPPDEIRRGQRHGALHRRCTRCIIPGHSRCGRRGCRLRCSVATRRAHALFHSGPGKQPFANRIRRNGAMPLCRSPSRGCPIRGRNGGRPLAPPDGVAHGPRYGALHRRSTRCGIAGHGGYGQRGCRLHRFVATRRAHFLFHSASIDSARHGGNGAHAGDEHRRADPWSRRHRRGFIPLLTRRYGGPFRGPVRWGPQR